MSKERVSIKRFDGVFGIGDAADHPPGVAFYAENLDLVTQDGSFLGLPKDEDYTGAYGHSEQIILYDDGNKAGVYNPTTGVFRLLQFNHAAKSVTEIKSETLGAGLDISMIANDQAIHFGIGASSATPSKRIGPYYHDQFGSAATSTPDVTDAQITSEAVGTAVKQSLGQSGGSSVELVLPDNKDLGGFDADARFENTQTRFFLDRNYTWYASAVYDGVQEAPLHKLCRIDLRQSNCFIYNGRDEGRGIYDVIDIIETKSIGGATHRSDNNTNQSWSIGNVTAKWQAAFATTGAAVTEAATGLKEIRFNIRVRTADSSGNGLPVISRRVSGIKIYRSESFFGESGNLVEAEPTFIKYLDLTSSEGFAAVSPSPSSASSADFDENGTYQFIQFADDGLPGTYTFENSTGYAATLEHMEINYALSCLSGGYHIVGKAWHRDLEDINSWLFRSKSYRFDSFDWANDYLVLPSQPTALIPFNGRVFAFTPGRVFVINPDIFDIEEVWDGYGVDDPRSVCVTESGLFWASRSGIYHYTSARVNNISAPVLRLTRPLTPGLDGNKERSLGWLDRDESTVPVITYSPLYDSVIVFYGAGAENPAFMYHVPTKRWSPISDLGEAVSNAHVTSQGEVIIGFEGGTFTRLFTDSGNRRPWRFVSRNLSAKGHIHKYYYAYVSTTISGAPPTTFYYRDDPEYRARISPNPLLNFQNVTDSDSDNLFRITLSQTANTWEQSRDYAIELVDANGNVGARDVTLIRKTFPAR